MHPHLPKKYIYYFLHMSLQSFAMAVSGSRGALHRFLQTLPPVTYPHRLLVTELEEVSIDYKCSNYHTCVQLITTSPFAKVSARTFVHLQISGND